MIRRGLIAALVSAGLGFSQSAQIKRTDALNNLSESLEAIAQQVSPAVVQVLVSGFRPASRNSPARGTIARQEGSGSGVIVDPAGYIITNNHVVEGSSKVRVMLPGDQGGASQQTLTKARSVLVEASVIGADHETDLAVLKIDGNKFPSLDLENSELLKQGQVVIAFGSPLGLQNSMTMGIVSSVARQIQTDDPMVYIQTDAPINPGSSGGPLLDTHGHVVGINTFIFSQSGGYEGLGFAVPSNIVKGVYEQIRKNGRVIRGEIGVNAYTITPVLADGLGLPRDRGVVLSDVLPDSPAEQAGLKPGDIVLSLDGKPMENARQFEVNLYARQENSKVRVKVLRGADTLEYPVPVRTRQSGVDQLAAGVSISKDLIRPLNILGISITKDTANLLPDLRSKSGIIVAALTYDPLYPDIGLEAGDVITEFNATPVVSVDALRAAIDSVESGDSVVLKVERDGRYIFVSFTAD